MFWKLTLSLLAYRDTFYTPDPVVGYTDYKFLDEIEPGTPTRTHYSGTKIFV